MLTTKHKETGTYNTTKVTLKLTKLGYRVSHWDTENTETVLLDTNNRVEACQSFRFHSNDLIRSIELGETAI